MNSPSVMYISKHHNKDPRRQKRSIFSLPLLIALISIIITTTAASASSPSPPPPLPSPPSPPPSLSISPGIIRKIVCLIIAYAVTVTTVSLASPAMFRMWQDYLTAWVDWFYSTSLSGSPIGTRFQR